MAVSNNQLQAAFLAARKLGVILQDDVLAAVINAAALAAEAESRPSCDICGQPKIALRKVTARGERTTYSCANTADANHREARRARRFAAQTARIEATINR